MRTHESEHGDNPRKKSYPVEPYGYPNLPFPETLLFGSVIAFLGIRLSNNKIIDCPLIYLVGD